MGPLYDTCGEGVMRWWGEGWGGRGEGWGPLTGIVRAWAYMLCNVKISPDHLMISSPDHLITFSPNYLVQQCSESRVKLSLPTKNLVSSLFCSDLQMQGPSPPKRICPSDLTFSAQMSLPFFLPKQHHLRYYTITYLSNSSVLSNFFF